MISVEHPEDPGYHSNESLARYSAIRALSYSENEKQSREAGWWNLIWCKAVSYYVDVSRRVYVHNKGRKCLRSRNGHKTPGVRN